MKRFGYSEWENEDGCMEQGGLVEVGDWGDWCLYEEAHQIEIDRDIKAANLKTLVDMVLGYADTCEQCARSGNDGGDIADANDAWKELIALARGLKQ
jgi:hypothetical protein